MDLNGYRLSDFPLLPAAGLLAAGLFIYIFVRFLCFCRISCPRRPYRLLLLPISQWGLMLLLSCALPVLLEENNGIRLALLLLAPLYLLADLLLLHLLYDLEKERKIRAEQEELERRLAIQADLCRNAMETDRVLKEFRHDLNNQLQTIFRLMEYGREQQAARSLEQLCRALEAQEVPDEMEYTHM